MGVVAHAQAVGGVQIDGECLTGHQAFLRGGRAGAAHVAGAVAGGDLVPAGEGPLPGGTGLAHAHRGDPGDLGLGVLPEPAVDDGVEDSHVLHPPSPRIAEAGYLSGFLDHSQPVDDIQRIR